MCNCALTSSIVIPLLPQHTHKIPDDPKTYDGYLTCYVSTSSLIGWNIHASGCTPTKIDSQNFRPIYKSYKPPTSVPLQSHSVCFSSSSVVQKSLFFSTIHRSRAMALTRAMFVLAMSFALVTLSIAQQAPSSAPTSSAQPPTTSTSPPPKRPSTPAPTSTATPPSTTPTSSPSPTSGGGEPTSSAASPGPSASSSPPAPPSSVEVPSAPTPRSPASSPGTLESSTPRSPAEAPVSSNPNNDGSVHGSSLALVALFGGAALILA